MNNFLRRRMWEPVDRHEKSKVTPTKTSLLLFQLMPSIKKSFGCSEKKFEKLSLSRRETDPPKPNGKPFLIDCFL